MRPCAIPFAGMDTADPNGVSVSQTPAGGGSQELTITGALASGGVATMDIARRVSITSAGNDSARTFTITGTDRYGDTLTEDITGPNATLVVGTKDFLTVTSVLVDDDTAGAILVGSSDETTSPWIPVDAHRNSVNISFSMSLSSDANFTYGVEHTFDNPFEGLPSSSFPHDSITGETTDQEGSYIVPIMAYRFVITSYVAGSSTFNAVQAGLVGN